MEKHNILALLAINFGAMVYWQVESFWINLYWVRLGDDSAFNVSLMVSITAIVGVITQIVIGALSDATKNPFGRRRLFILVGGIFGAFSICLFPLVRVFSPDVAKMLGIAIILDIFITIFGEMTTPTRSALFTENTVVEERGRMQALMSVAMGGGSGLIMLIYVLDCIGDDWYFYVAGFWFLVGSIVCFYYVDDKPTKRNQETFRYYISNFFRTDSYKDNPSFYHLLLLLGIASFANNIYINHVYLYCEKALELSQEKVGIIGIMNMIFIAVLTLPTVALADKVGRKAVAIISIMIGSTFLFLVFQLNTRSPLLLGTMFGIAAGMITSSQLAIGTWLQDICSPNMRGSFLAYQSVVIVIPMAPGSLLGGWIADRFASAPGVYSPLIFLVAALAMICVLPGLLKIRESLPTVKIKVLEKK